MSRDLATLEDFKISSHFGGREVRLVIQLTNISNKDYGVLDYSDVVKLLLVLLAWLFERRGRT